MTATFETGLFGTTTTGTFVKCLAFTLPPAASSTSHTISVSLPSGVTVQSVTIPGEMDWASNTLTIPSTFTDSSSRVILDLSNGANAIFSVILSGSPQNGVASSLQVNANGWMNVTSTGQGVTFKGFTPLIQSIPEDGSVTLQDAVFLIPSVSGSQDFTFSAPASQLSTSDSDAVSITESGTLATIQGSNLAPGETVTLTVSSSGSTVSFIVQRLESGTISSGSQSVVLASSDGILSVFSLASGALLRGNNLDYMTDAPSAFEFEFSIATSNFSFVSPFAILSNTSDFSLDTTTTSFVRITHEDTGPASTSLTLLTNAGTWDPTIINNGDPNP
jgi:hypothetical protein